jgi:DNA-binding transcriptional LysR family regulator
MQRHTEVRQQIAIVMLAEELSFTRTAKRLKVSQSTITRRIISFEARHHIQLFLRDKSNVSLTDGGRIFVEETKLSLLHNERAIEAARGAFEGTESILIVGKSPFADPVLTSLLLSIRLPLYPDLVLKVHSDFAPELVHDLIVSKLDLALIANPGSNKKLTMTKVIESPLYVVLPENSALASQTFVTLRDLSEETWILFERKAHPAMFDSLLRRAQEEGITVRDGLKFLSAEEAAQFVSEHLGVAFMTAVGARRIAERGAVVRPLADPELKVTVCLASRADNKSKVLSEFVRAFMRRASQVFTPVQMKLPVMSETPSIWRKEA